MLFSIESRAPVRICDNGGWTDTWFAKHGRIFNIAVDPGVVVEIECFKAVEGRPSVRLQAVDYGDDYAVDLTRASWQRHPLLEATLKQWGVPAGITINVIVTSEIPAGAATGTSAAVTVALIGALAQLHQQQLTPQEIAQRAHQVETDLLGQQSGIQDQLASAYGGINDIHMQTYPEATVAGLGIDERFREELERRLLLIYLGKEHQSSHIHEAVITHLEAGDATEAKLNPLRAAAAASCRAMRKQDFDALGRAMIANNEAQRALHPALISPQADTIIELAKMHGVLGWKVNGAGGDGGSLTLLCGPSHEGRSALLASIHAADPAFRHIPTTLNKHGLQVTQIPHNA